MDLFATVNPSFDYDSFDGVLVCGDTDRDLGFTELGYDNYEDGVDPSDVITINVTTVSDELKFADIDDLERIAREVCPVYETWADAPEIVGAYEDNRSEFIVLEETPGNVIISDYPAVREKLTEEGFDGFRDFVPVTNIEPVLTVFWDKSKYRTSVPAPSPT